MVIIDLKPRRNGWRYMVSESFDDLKKALLARGFKYADRTLRMHTFEKDGNKVFAVNRNGTYVCPYARSF